MTTGLTYSQFLSNIATLAVVSESDANFLSILPQAITYAENRMCRDLDFLSTVSANTSYYFTANTRYVTVPASAFVTLQQVNVLTPVGQTNPDSVTATRNPLLPTTKEFLDAVYGSASGAGVPQYFAMVDQNKYIVGPWPDAAYYMELVGTIRPDSLSADNPSTFISLYLPDLLIMATMVFISGYQRNFGRMNDDPQMAISYEGQYQTLLKGAVVEEARKKFQSGAWSSMSPAAVATPTRG